MNTKKSGINGSMIAVASIGLMCLMALSVLAPVAGAATAPSWNYAFPLGGARAQAVVVQADNGVVFVIGGVTGIGYAPVGDVSAYNPSTGTWANLAPLPTATRGASGGIGADGRIYIFDGTIHATQIYNITSDSWSAGATIPTTDHLWEAKCAISGDHAYVFGGEGLSSYENLTWIYNMTTDTWWAGADMLYAVKAGAVVADGGYAYYFGGVNESGMAITNVSRYDIATDSWSRMAPLPSGICGEAAAVGPDGLSYVFGGADRALNTGMGEVYSATYTYDPASNTWATVDDMNIARAWLGAAVSDNKILSIGGNIQTAVYLTVESLDTLQNQLNNLQDQLAQANDNNSQLRQQLIDLGAKLNQTNDELDARDSQLNQELVNLGAKLNQTRDDLNSSLGTTNNGVSDAKDAANSANTMALLGVILAVIAIILIVVNIVLTMRKKS